VTELGEDNGEWIMENGELRIDNEKRLVLNASAFFVL
jgi:hypothetical protein